jgi:signal transduction histidine kinase
MKFAAKCLTFLLMFLPWQQVKAQLLTQTQEKVTIYLSWKHQFQFAGYYAAIENGYFKERGLDVVLVENNTIDNVERAIIDGKYMYGVGIAGLLLANDDYKKLSVLAAIFQQSAVSLIGLKSNGINNLRDLNNSDIIGSIETKAMLMSARVNIDSVRFHGKQASFEDLISGKYDAISFYITDQAKLLGNDSLMFNIFRPLEYGINFYGECLYTSREEVLTNPERALKMRAAVIEGWEYAIDHPDEIIRLIQKKYNNSLTYDELAREADITINKLILPMFHDVGDMQNSKWEQMAKLIYDFGIVSEKRDLEGFLYTAPESDREAAKVFFIIATLLVSAALLISLVLFLYNKQLKKAVAARTNLLEKANKEMDRFVYSISHDIRSPLSSVQGLINIMKIEPEDHEKYLALIESSIIKLDNYTKDILDYTRNSRAKLRPQVIDLNVVVDKCIEQLKYANNSTNMVFNKNINLQSTFCSDPWRLEVIINNILSNSLKYQERSRQQPYINIDAELVNDKLKLVIADNGIGIDKHHLSKIYGMFYRASEDSQGSGLGLYIVSETINLLNGNIDIQSVVGEGTTITIELPNMNEEQVITE